MRRVVSLWLPTWPTDRIRRSASAPPVETPLVTARAERGQRWIAAADAAAAKLGLYPGMKLAQAQAMVPGLMVVPADPAGDDAALARLAAWCLRYAPFTAPDPPDGVWIDVTGAAHLHGGEAALRDDLLGRLHDRKIAARAAIADTPGAASALARYGGNETCVLPPGQAGGVLPALPVAALRLPAETLAGLSALGFERIGALEATARGPLARRFGPIVLERLDQAFGRRFEPIEPITPPAALVQRQVFLEPLCTAEAFSTVIAQLSAALCQQLEQRGQGARRLDLRFERVDGSAQTISIGTARASRHPTHLARLLDERLEQVDPGMGVEAMGLVVPLAEALAPQQAEWAQASDEPDLALLIDRLDNRLGVGRVYRAAPVESDVPERSVRAIAPLAPPCGANWPDLPRPTRLLRPPQPVEVMALLPDHPPVAFTWRRKRHRVRHADGPERIYGEWEQRDRELWAVRDYFRVEDADGRRFWLYRNGELRWFLHGFY
jgi:protein ImuB